MARNYQTNCTSQLVEGRTTYVPIDIMRVSSVWTVQFIVVRQVPEDAADKVIVCTTSPESATTSTKALLMDQILTILPDPEQRLVIDGSRKDWPYFGKNFGSLPEVELESHRKLGSPGASRFSTSESLQGHSISFLIKGR